MKARDLVYETFSALDANRGRSLLTVLGIVIGISAVIAMTALIGGVKQSIIGELGLDQARLVYVSCWYNRPQTLDDVDAMAREMADDYEYVLPMTYGGSEISSDTAKVSNGQVMGVTAEYGQAMGVRLVQGRWINKQEEQSGALSLVIDQAGAKVLFGSPDADCVGKSLRIGGAQYVVVGVLEANYVQGNNDSAQVYMPFLTCCNRVNGWTSVDQIIALAHEGSDMEAVATRTEDWMARHYGVPEEDRDVIYVQTMASVIQELDTTMLAFEVLMTSVASISLLVGGIGIMNMMLTNVTERIREIGLRKALGAKSRDITRQFLLESICLTLVGGIIGMALGYLGAYALGGLAGGMLELTSGGGGITPYLDVRSMLMVAGICVAIGVVFGYYPARRAARLDPVESLHYQ